MKRRNFFKGIGLGIGSGFLAPHAWADPFTPKTYQYPGINSLADATNDEGEVAVRLSWANSGKESRSITASIKLKGKGTLARTNRYFLEPPDQVTPRMDRWESAVYPADEDVWVAWLKDVDESSVLQVKGPMESWQFSLGEVLEKGQLEFGENRLLTANLLGYREVGKLDTSTLNIPDQENFRFVILADPQGGDPATPNNEAPTRMKIHNAFIEETVEIVNGLSPQPVFALILGDFVDSKGQAGNFELMEKLIEPLNMPVLLEVGNHETPYNADFTPAYNMSSLDNFFDSQKRVNGTEKMLYSFDLGKWHFVVWPDPLRKNFWSTHPHYFDWLERDLAENRGKPTFFLHHVPLHPIGIDPLTTYVESVAVKKTLMDILSRHGNVKNVFSGHVHIPLKASLKTAVSYRGINFINLPAAGFRARAFGEADFFGGPEQGACILDVKGEDVVVHFQHVTREWFTYPKELPVFDEEQHALWFRQPWELPLQPKLANGNFTQKLDHWHQRFVYHEDENPSNVCEIREKLGEGESLFLYSRKRDYDVPGQDRLPQHINRIAQAVSLKNLSKPVLQLHYQPDSETFHSETLNGFFLWVECYAQAQNVANLIYSVGKVYGSVTGRFGSGGKAPVHHYDLPAETGKWHEATLPIATDFQSADEESRPFGSLNADRAVIYLGTWTVNEGIGQSAGIWIKEVNLANGSGTEKPTVPKKPEDIWWSRIDHIAGDHQYADQSAVYPEGLRGEGKPTP